MRDATKVCWRVVTARVVVAMTEAEYARWRSGKEVMR